MSLPNSASILTPRLELVPLTPPILRAILAGDSALTASLLQTRGPAVWPGDQKVLELRLNQLLADPSEQPFLLRAMIHRARRELVGHIGFHTPPDPPYLLDLGLKGLEFGYTVFEPWRRQGFATEASAALMEWARAVHDVRNFVLSIAPNNEPSLRIARRLGFSYHSVYNDPADGTEHVYRRAFSA